MSPQAAAIALAVALTYLLATTVVSGVKAVGHQVARAGHAIARVVHHRHHDEGDQTMKEPITLKPGEPCPGCGGTLRKAPQPTESQRAHAANRDDPRPLPPHFDTAPLEVVQELGELWKCPECGYPARFKPEAVKPNATAAPVAQ